MKNTIVFIFSVLCAAMAIVSCKDEALKERSIFDREIEQTQNVLDEWIRQNYNLPYNIEVIYKWKDVEANMGYELIPPEIPRSYQLLKIVLYTWIDAYGEVMGFDFVKSHMPRQIMLVGSKAWKTNSTWLDGTAEGGMKVTLFNVNGLMINNSFLNDNYLKVMHHEFAHILHQIKEIPVEFEEIARNDYILDDWNRGTAEDALTAGFITKYSRSQAREDFVELISCYVTYSEVAWKAAMKTAGEQGELLINRKMAIVRQYLNDEWNLDIDELHAVFQRRLDDLASLDLDFDNILNEQ